MLRGIEHTHYFNLDKDSKIFKFRQRTGNIVYRKFKYDDKFVLIFEINNYQFIKSGEMLDIFKYVDKDADKYINFITINYAKFNIRNELIEVLNEKADSFYNSCFMVVLNQDIDSKIIEKFWLMTDIYTKESFDNPDFNSYSSRLSIYKNIYMDKILGTKKRSCDYNFEESNEYILKKSRRESDDSLSYKIDEFEKSKLNQLPKLNYLYEINEQKLKVLEHKYSKCYRDATHFKKELETVKKEIEFYKKENQKLIINNAELSTNNERLISQITKMNTRYNTKYPSLYN